MKKLSPALPHLILLMAMGSGWSLHAVAQATDEAAAPAVEPTVPAGETEAAASEEEAPVKRRLPRDAKVAYSHSRFTSDRTETEADHRSLILGMGVDKIIDLDPTVKLGDRTGSILEGNTNVIKVIPARIGDQTQLIFKALSEGETNVAIRDKTGKVKVIFDVIVAKQNLVRMLDDLKRNLRDVEGVEVRIEGQRLVIDGEVLTPNDYGTIINVISDRMYADSVSNRVVMSPVTLNALAKKIEQDIQVFAPTVHTTVLNGKIILEGTVESAGIKDRCMRRAEWYLPTVKLSDPINKDANNVEKNDKPVQIIQSDIQVTPPAPKRESKLIRLTVYFVELSKDFLKTFGFKWQPGFTADPSISIGSTSTGDTSTTGAGGFTFAGTLSSLFPALNAPPSSASYGRVLKNTTIVVKSQEKATVRDTQQIPTQTLGQNGTVGNGPPVTIGFSSEITPTILQGQDVDLSISLDQTSQVGKGAGGAPITATHHVESRLYLKSGEVAAVAGVNKQDVSTAFNRDDPNAGSFSGSTKPLFTLQRSKNMSKAKGQFVIFVNPQIIESASEGTEDLKKNFRIKSSQ
jgi:pilus assembly protein CpaC